MSLHFLNTGEDKLRRPRYPNGRVTRKCLVCKTIVGAKTTRHCGRTTRSAFVYNA